MILRALSALWTSYAQQMANHLWQSTLFIALAAILSFALRRNQGRVRYWVWLTASLKFLLPFSLLIALGSHLAKPRATTPAQTVVYSAVEDFSQPFAEPEMPLISPAAPAPVSRLHLLPPIIVALWLAGIAVVLLVWATGWVRVSLMVHRALPLRQGPEVEALRRLESSFAVRKPIQLVLSRNWMEPGIFGVFRPVLIWPEGISQHLDARHIDAILAHEISHARRHDNFTAILHMLVEAIFWFHPLVWWMGARLEEERERACDEEVSLLCNQPHVYAESILRVCKFCSESPLACVSGITGADLKKRIVQIMTGRVARKLDLRRKLLLLAVAAAAVVAPVALGLARMPLIFGQILKASGPRPSFEVASIHMWKRPAPPPEMVGGEQVIHQQTVKFSPGNGGGQTSDHVHIIAPLGVLIAQAYGLPPGSDGRGDGRIVGGPDWMAQDDEQYDIQAKIDEQEYAAIQKMTAEQQREQVNLMKQSLLADRFKLKVHFETRELPAYALVVAKGGPKLTAAKEGEPTRLSSTRQGQTTEMSVTGTTLPQFAQSPLLSGGTGSRTVLDQTGLKGKYDFTLKWGANFAVGGQEPSDEPALFTAIQDQLGLKLVPTKGPVEVIVIDRIEKPSVDGAEVRDTSLKPVAVVQEKPVAESSARSQPQNTAAPSARYEYEAATVKPSKGPGPRGKEGLWAAPDGFSAWFITPQQIIAIAYGVKSFQVSGGPSWLPSDRFDIEAKMDAATADALAKLSEDQRALAQQQMLQALLADRFQLTVHRETKELTTYTLVIAKGGPKLQEAKPGDTYPNGYKFLDGTHAGAGDMMGGVLDGKMTGQAVPIARLVLSLTQMLGHPVSDKTELKGVYDFKLRFTPDDRLQPPSGSPPNFRFPLPPADSSAPSLFDALQEQLGLKLESAKRPVEVIVIDRVERPSGN